MQTVGAIPLIGVLFAGAPGIWGTSSAGWSLCHGISTSLRTFIEHGEDRKTTVNHDLQGNHTSKLVSPHSTNRYLLFMLCTMQVMQVLLCRARKCITNSTPVILRVKVNKVVLLKVLFWRCSVWLILSFFIIWWITGRWWPSPSWPWTRTCTLLIFFVSLNKIR